MPVALLFLLAVTFAAWCGIVVTYTAWRAIRPPRMNDGKALYLLKRLSPEDLGLAFAPLRFDVRDERRRPLTIAAWWMPAAAPSGKAVILLHGYGDAKIGGIAWAPTWHALGWNVLAIDQRGHGESGGRYCTGGFFERDDLDQVIDQLRAQKPTAAEHVALFGVSLGSGAVTGAAARRNDLAAVVLDSPFADYRNAIRSHLRRLNAPLAVLHGLIVRVAERWCGADWAAGRPADWLRQISCPVLIVRGADDDFVDPADLAALSDALAAGRAGQQVVFEDAHHTLALTRDPLRYRKIIADFLEQAAHSGAFPNRPRNEIETVATSSTTGEMNGV